MGGRLFGREPVMTVSAIVALLIAVLPFFGWPGETVGAVAAALVLTGGAVEAALVSVDRLLPLLVGVAKAVLAAVAAFGVHLPDNHVAAIMAVLTVVAGFATRTQVGAVQPPVNRDGQQVGPIHGQVVEFELDTTADDAPEGGHHMRTEVFGAVVADGSLPEARDDDGDREYRPRHGQRYGSRSGELRPDFGL